MVTLVLLSLLIMFLNGVFPGAWKAWCLTAAVISAGSSCGSREERPGSTHSSCTAGTEPPRYDCTTCTSTTVVRGQGEGERWRDLHLKKRKRERKKKQQRGDGGVGTEESKGEGKGGE